MGTVICQVFNMIKVVAVLCGLSLVQCGVPSCETVYEEKCWDEPRQQCNTVQKPFTTTQYEQGAIPSRFPRWSLFLSRSAPVFLSRNAILLMRNSATLNMSRSATPGMSRPATPPPRGSALM